MDGSPPKKKISVIAGDLYDLNFLELFALLPASEYAVQVCLLDSECLRHYSSPMPLITFESVPDMPGYLRGLESYISDSNIIIAIGPSKLSSFQAVRIGAKCGIPVLTCCSEVTPFRFVNSKNILAIQAEVFNRSRSLLAFSDAAKLKLECEGVPTDNCTVIPSFALHSKFQYEAKIRKKFLDYIGIDEQTSLVVYYIGSDSLGSERHKQFLHALVLLKNKYPNAYESVRIMFLGENSHHHDEFKYLACDLGVGQHVVFLNQDFRPFAKDLFCSVDLFIHASAGGGNAHELYPRWLLDASAAGAITATYSGAIASELVCEVGIAFEDKIYEIAAMICDSIEMPEQRELKRLSRSKKLIESRNIEISAQQLHQVFKELESHRMGDLNDGIEGKVQKIANLMQGSHFAEASDLADELLSACDSFGSGILAKIWVLKGKALFGDRDLLGAMNAFENSLKCDRREIAAIVGLGQVSQASLAFEEALEFYKKALALDANNREAVLGVGLLYRAIGDFEEGVYWLKRSLMDYDIWENAALVAFVQVVAQVRDLGKAICHLEEVREHIGDRPTLMMALGRIYIKQGFQEDGQRILDSIMTKAESS